MISFAIYILLAWWALLILLAAALSFSAFCFRYFCSLPYPPFPPRSKAGSHLPAGNSNVASTHNAGLGNQNPPGASPLVFSHRCAPGDFDFELQRTFWRLRDDILYGNLPDSTLARQQLQTLLAKHRYRQTP